MDGQDAPETLLARVGERVRRARTMRGLPRRVLSDRSGVSPRYLAQLEAGEGNVSIALLDRVAAALDHPIEWFVTPADPAAEDDLARMAALWRDAAPDARARALDLLSADRAGRRAGRVALVGLRGAGKSTLGAALAERLDVPFVELNAVIAADAGMAAGEIIALYGQEGYRRLEAAALEEVAGAHARVVLAVGGGIVAEADTYATLLGRFHTVWLRAAPEEHMARVRAQGDERPMAGNPAAMEQLRSILTSREALYARAGRVLDTSGKAVGDSLAELEAVAGDLLG
ncbi:helix-turn-helix transcriptional regulator [Jannaschia sp. Os4]|uniref:helix-turn-helix transcriptional regulator n=1 Tax=Jannaschia sp. Os4 TaxID=2807617 RepID=UPI00193ACDE7|nr:helix-turn-helix transcriptional regulator [Jannaschia sp. Os4]MBM2575129.1 helix-turn-helix transcriptional regulator [Jannaschia sp. Os4]